MIPWIAAIRVEGPHTGRHRFWLPLVLLWLILLPLAVLLAPVAFVVCLALGIPPIRTLSALWQVITGMQGTQVEVNNHGTAVSVRIS